MYKEIEKFSQFILGLMEQCRSSLENDIDANKISTETYLERKAVLQAMTADHLVGAGLFRMFRYLTDIKGVRYDNQGVLIAWNENATIAATAHTSSVHSVTVSTHT